jgi:hypothetical protein
MSPRSVPAKDLVLERFSWRGTVGGGWCAEDRGFVVRLGEKSLF